MNSGSASGIHHDAPHRGDANASLAEELERAKQDLELIVYAVSHDLKTPLRTIVASYEALNEIAGVRVNKEARVQLEKIERESNRMKSLMQGMVDYLYLETYGPARSQIDCNELVETALSLLEDKIRSSGAKITCGSLPEVYGHRGRLTRLFVSLIDNAIKFHGSMPPLVRIYGQAAPKKGFVEFRIQDNGIGIEKEFSENIFHLFRRLHSADEYPGEGIGLALSRKIVESHGGTIDVTSVVKEGSCFRFLLPAIKM